MTDPVADRPRLASGLAAFAIGNAAGDLAWTRECRGAAMDWGGVYAQGVRLTGPWQERIGLDGGAVAPMPAPVEVSERPGSFRSVRSLPFGELVTEVAAHPQLPAVLIDHRLRATGTSSAHVVAEAEFVPALAPVLLEGIRPPELVLQLRGADLWWDGGGFVASLQGEPGGTELLLDGAPSTGATRRGPRPTVTLRHRLLVAPGGDAAWRFVLRGGRRGGQTADPGTLPPADWAAASAGAVADWEGRAPALDLPDAPDLARAYALARRSLRLLYTEPEAGFTGLVAGYPWYAALWCRDLARMAPALLWMGDPEWLAGSLRTVFRFQAPHRNPLLAAEAGEIPMQISPGPIFLYGTSDTSLYYPGIVERYVRHTGDEASVGRWLPHLERIRGWGEAKLSATSGLFRNGGEIEELRSASAAAGRVHVGIDATDTTIWDSADRRDHANDLQLLWLDTLRALARLSDLPGAPAEWRAFAARAEAFARTLPGRFDWPEEGYLVDSLRVDGRPVRRVRPNALQWVGERILDPSAERRVVERATRPDLAAPWGLRTLVATDPSFDPAAYHMGQVWPIATAWLARAAFAIGASDLGVAWLERLAAGILSEGGFANECYRGDRPEPFDSCFLLGFSVAPFLSTFFEGLWGLAPDARRATLGVDPRMPSTWSGMTLRGLAFAGGRIDLRATRDGVEGHWEGPRPIVLAGPHHARELAPGETGRCA